MFDLDAMQEANDRLREIEAQVDEARIRFEMTMSETSQLRDLNKQLIARSREVRQFRNSGGCPVAHRA